jgi:hypothetical protein
MTNCPGVVVLGCARVRPETTPVVPTPEDPNTAGTGLFIWLKYSRKMFINCSWY